MFINKGNSSFFQKCLAVFLAIAFLFPLVVKQIHEIGHNHEIVKCDDHHQYDHFHKYENDCDLCKFKLNNNGLLIINPFTSIKRDFVYLKDNSKSYSYPYNHQKFSYLLRAPPYGL